MNWGNDKHKRMYVKFLMEQYAFLKDPGTVCPYLPDGLDVDISNRCNIRCISCFHDVDKFKAMPDMAFDTLTTVLDQAKGKASRITVGNHGEPFLHKEVFRFLREIKARGFFLNLINNGTLMDEGKARELIEICPDRLVFSLDSVDPEQYPKIRKHARLDITLKNILTFLKLNYEAGSKVYVNISTVDTEQSLASRTNIFEYFSKLPVHVVYTSPILNFHDMLSIKEQTNFQKHYKGITDPKKLPVCINGFDRLLIRPNGNASLCGIDWDSVHVLGNIKEVPYYELWNNPKAQEFRRALLTRDYSQIERNGVLCSKCDSKWACSIEKQIGASIELLAGDLRDQKSELTAKIHTRERYENLLRAISSLAETKNKA